MPCFQRRHSLYFSALAFAVALLTALWPARASAEDAGSMEAGARDSMAEELAATADSVRALANDTLAPEIDPRSLFDLDPADDDAVTLERMRLEGTLAAFATRDAGPDAGLPSERWEARLDLDRARLSFLELPPARRAELLEHHRARAALAQTPAADRRTLEAEEKRQEALAAAQLARSEAERVVKEEYARLLQVEADQAAFEKKLAAGQAKIDAGREATLVWERRGREARTGEVRPERADAIYDEIRRALRIARDELDVTLRDAASPSSEVPVPGDDPLASLQTNVDVAAARAERERVVANAVRLTAEEKAYQDERASQLLDAVDALNAERMALLPHLSSDKRAAIIGFTNAGLDQAAAEVRQLTLIARYHRFVATEWLAAARQGHRSAALSAGAMVIVALEWLAVIAPFLWLRRRLPIALQLMWKRARAEDRRLRLPRPSIPTRVIGFVVGTYGPVLWLALALALSWLLPPAARNLLEIRLLSISVEWIVGGALVVAAVNAFAGAGPEGAEHGAPALRLRSLRLVGRVVVAFGLVLALTSRLVGPGTIYQWVFSTCWLASIPVFLTLVRWWRGTVFERTERSRRKSAFERWLLAHQRGWKSLVAATAGAIYLFGRGAWRVGRTWVGHFAVTRTVLAYLFRRELGKLEAERAEIVSTAIPDDAFEALGPDRSSPSRIAIDADEALQRLRDRIREKQGGVVALVGALGIGKTTTLELLRQELGERSLFIEVPLDPGAAFAKTVTKTIDDAPDVGAVLLDDAQRLVRPMMGGLAPFDALLDAAQERAQRATWIVAFDDILWLFLQRTRGSRPLFDDVIHLSPWHEEQLAQLLVTRTAAAGLEPSFENLLDRLPAHADEVDRQEALEERAANYYRLLWDYAGGNPAIALHMWRRALGRDANGVTHVRFFQAPNADELEPLPDQAVFVLRAILQLGAAKAEDIAATTMLPHADIADTLRYAHSRGYVLVDRERYRVTWTWLRAVSVFLQRRHLLVRS